MLSSQSRCPIKKRFGKTGFQKTLEELSPNQRETWRLHFFEGYSLAEIATRLGQSGGNIKQRYFRGLEKLRKQLLPGKLQTDRSVSQRG
jgi:RNA polymerase sigma-70 factor (ECF subfamily)